MKTKIKTTKKKCKNIKYINYGRGQIDMCDATAKINSTRMYRHYSQYAGKFHFPKYQIMETYKHIYSKVRYKDPRPRFIPGQEVYIIVFNYHNNDLKIVKTKILEVSFYGYLKNGYRIDYWVSEYGSGHGVDQDCIFPNYNAAKFFLYY